MPSRPDLRREVFYGSVVTFGGGYLLIASIFNLPIVEFSGNELLDRPVNGLLGIITMLYGAVGTTRSYGKLKYEEAG
jgi:hypothetical protein